MGSAGSKNTPLNSFTADQATEHWKNGRGEKVYVDMHSFMTSGPGKAYTISDFAGQIADLSDNLLKDINS